MKNSVVLIIGPSGSGKTTLEKELHTKLGYYRVVSHTSRPKRPGEVDGVDYHFVPVESFQDGSIEFIEKLNFLGNYYGVSAAELKKETKYAVAVVEPNGARQIMEKLKETHHIVPVFMSIPREVCLRNMIEGRGANPEEAAKRLDKETIREDFEKMEVAKALRIYDLDADLYKRVDRFVQSFTHKH